MELRYVEKVKNILDVEEEYYIAHCISSDCVMGAGVAVEIEREFDLKPILLQIPYQLRKHPTCIRVERVYNLITKDKYWHKPTYSTLRHSLERMKLQMLENGHTKLAMPRIASGLDKLEWTKVRDIIIEVFWNSNVDILVCFWK